MIVPDRLRKILVPLLVMGIAGLSVWLFQGQPHKGKAVRAKLRNVPDAFMENFTSEILNKQGQPRYQLHASRMAHYADDDRSELANPQFIAFRPGGQRWTMVAESGEALEGTQRIMLKGAVTIQRQDAAQVPVSLEIRTRDVRIQPAKDTAESDQPTTIIHGKDTLEGVGLRANFRQGQLQLLSQVRGTYAP